MGWLLIAVGTACLFWLARRANDQAAEYAAAGLYRSPLYWSAIALTLSLVGLSLFMARVQHQGPVPGWMWVAAFAIFGLILLLRRALKWRYPI